jgi:hypothetical protein
MIVPLHIHPGAGKTTKVNMTGPQGTTIPWRRIRYRCEALGMVNAICLDVGR